MQFVWEVRISFKINSKPETMLFYTKEQAEKFLDYHMAKTRESQLTHDVIYSVVQKPIHGESYIEELGTNSMKK